MNRPAARAHRPDAMGELTRWIAVLFLVGSACFAGAALPGLAAVVAPELLGVVFFVGSLFFTAAAALQFRQASADPSAGVLRSGAPLRWYPARVAWLAALVQLAGTIWFNVNTFDALRLVSKPGHEDLRVWTPDMVGSICFLVASGLALWPVRYLRGGRHQRNRDRSIAVANMTGSVLFMLAAVAAFVRPDTTEPVAAGVANTGTCLGALCFLWGALLLLRGVGRAMGSDRTADLQ